MVCERFEVEVFDVFQVFAMRLVCDFCVQRLMCWELCGCLKCLRCLTLSRLLL